METGVQPIQVGSDRQVFRHPSLNNVIPAIFASSISSVLIFAAVNEVLCWILWRRMDMLNPYIVEFFYGISTDIFSINIVLIPISMVLISLIHLVLRMFRRKGMISYLIAGFVTALIGIPVLAIWYWICFALPYVLFGWKDQLHEIQGKYDIIHLMLMGAPPCLCTGIGVAAIFWKLAYRMPEESLAGSARE